VFGGQSNSCRVILKSIRVKLGPLAYASHQLEAITSTSGLNGNFSHPKYFTVGRRASLEGSPNKYGFIYFLFNNNPWLIVMYKYYSIYLCCTKLKHYKKKNRKKLAHSNWKLNRYLPEFPWIFLPNHHDYIETVLNKEKMFWSRPALNPILFGRNYSILQTKNPVWEHKDMIFISL
jgi:hypothetical protein